MKNKLLKKENKNIVTGVGIDMKKRDLLKAYFILPANTGTCDNFFSLKHFITTNPSFLMFFKYKKQCVG